MHRDRSEILGWIEAGRVVPGDAQAALRAARVIPSRSDWRSFLGHLTLWLGTVALAAAIIFFFAFNWDDLGRFAKFGLVEAAIVAALLACWRVDLDGMIGKALLVLLSLLVGALLALSGQIYQTGADTYELFAWWAVLILPWVLVSRFSPLWLVWLFILNLALSAWFGLFGDGDALLWALLALDTLALAAWEAGHAAGLKWLRDEWPPRLAAMASAFMATSLIVSQIFGGSGTEELLAALAYAVWLACLYAWYRHVRTDLFMLAVGVLSLIVAVAALLADIMFTSGDSAGGYLLIGLVVIGMSAGGALWLRSAAQEQEA